MTKILNGAAIALAVLFVFGAAAISILGIADPVKASAGFGMPVSNAAGILFYRVFASRNIAIALAGGSFLFLRDWRSLAILVGLASLLALSDMAVLFLAGARPPALHAVGFGVNLLTSILLWRKAQHASA